MSDIIFAFLVKHAPIAEIFASKQCSVIGKLCQTKDLFA